MKKRRFKLKMDPKSIWFHQFHKTIISLLVCLFGQTVQLSDVLITCLCTPIRLVLTLGTEVDTTAIGTKTSQNIRHPDDVPFTLPRCSSDFTSEIWTQPMQLCIYCAMYIFLENRNSSEVLCHGTVLYYRATVHKSISGRRSANIQSSNS